MRTRRDTLYAHRPRNMFNKFQHMQQRGSCSLRNIFDDEIIMQTMNVQGRAVQRCFGLFLTREPHFRVNLMFFRYSIGTKSHGRENI